MRKRYYSYVIFRVSPDHSQRKTDLKKTKGAFVHSEMVITPDEDMTSVPVISE